MAIFVSSGLIEAERSEFSETHTGVPQTKTICFFLGIAYHTSQLLRQG